MRRLVGVELDGSIRRLTPERERERTVAVADLLAENSFAPEGDPGEGPYRLLLSANGGRLVFAVSRAGGEAVIAHALALGPLRRAVKDYALIRESHDEAVRSGNLMRVEAVDMGRRGLHDEGGALLASRLGGKIAMDHATARRLFTLVCALHGWD